jgi:hypothetical protein
MSSKRDLGTGWPTDVQSVQDKKLRYIECQAKETWVRDGLHKKLGMDTLDKILEYRVSRNRSWNTGCPGIEPGIQGVQE